jgi:hypothetical protein
LTDFDGNGVPTLVEAASQDLGSFIEYHSVVLGTKPGVLGIKPGMTLGWF